MLAYIPFIYFTILLICHLTNKNMRFGAGAVSLVWIDISAFFSIWLEKYNLYGQFGCNENAISFAGVLLYCILWTIVLFPLLKLDQKDINIVSTINKPNFFKYLCIFIILCMIIHLLTMDFSELISQLSIDSSDLYLEKQSRTVYTGGARNFLLWIPNTVASFTVLYNLCWFISLSVCKQSKIVNILLLLSSSISMLVGFASGGRAALLWWTLTFLVFYFFFKPNLSSKQVHAINLTFSIFAGIGLFGFIIITLSRFDDGANNALLSFIGYAGQQLNNFCALLPHIDLSHLYPDRLFPLSQYILTNEPLKLSEYYAFLSSIYPIQVNVFFTLFGELLMDTGIIGLLLFICLYTTIAISISRNRSIESYQLFVLAILFCIPVRGLFAWPFSNYFESLYLLFSVGLFIIFKYNLKFGQKHLL